MAQVDFSNAVLDVYNSSARPFAYSNYLNIPYEATVYDDQSGNSINGSASVNIILNTPTKVSILFTGVFTASGTSFHTNRSVWGVSNISFSAGDTYSFVIDIEVSGNT